MFVCPFCHKEFWYERGLKAHIRQKHKDEYPEWKKDPKFETRVCKNCGESRLGENEKYCSECRNETRAWKILENGQTKALSVGDAQELSDPTEAKKPADGTFLVIWPFDSSMQPEFQQFKDGEFDTYVSINAKQVAAAAKLLKARGGS